jgi:hypothetical protein
MSAKKRFAVGDKVRLTGEFLRNTGQIAGSEGQSTWLVVECPCGLCADGRFVATNQPSYDDPSRPRHFNAANLERKR